MNFESRDWELRFSVNIVFQTSDFPMFDKKVTQRTFSAAFLSLKHVLFYLQSTENLLLFGKYIR